MAEQHTAQTLKVGLTGGIASGKTLAQRYFEKLGVKAIDHDLIAKAIVEPGEPGLVQLVDTFGSTLLTSTNHLDRLKLKKMIFHDQDMKAQVEAILHPLVFQQSSLLIQGYATEPYVLIVSPLLIESGRADAMDMLIVIDVPQEIQLARLLLRDGIDKELACSIINNQATRSQRQAAADILISNAGSQVQLENEVRQAHQRIMLNCSA